MKDVNSVSFLYISAMTADKRKTYYSMGVTLFVFFFSSRRRHTRFDCDWSSDVCSSDLGLEPFVSKKLVVVHPLGGCPIGGSSTDGVVNSNGQVYNTTAGAQTVYDGLYEIGRASCRERV